MDTLDTTTTTDPTSPTALAPPEPGHLHFDRASRRWLNHDRDGSLQPYLERLQPAGGGDGTDGHAVAA